MKSLEKFVKVKNSWNFSTFSTSCGIMFLYSSYSTSWWDNLWHETWMDCCDNNLLALDLRGLWLLYRNLLLSTKNEWKYQRKSSSSISSVQPPIWGEWLETFKLLSPCSIRWERCLTSENISKFCRINLMKRMWIISLLLSRLSPHFSTKINRDDPSLLSNNYLNETENRAHGNSKSKEEWFV